MDEIDAQVAARRDRLSQVLDALEKHGLSQREIAMRACVPPQYFSDVKLGRRSLSELFARRLGEEFDVDHIWLMTGTGSMKRPRAWSADAEPKRSTLIPILNQPTAGEPRHAGHWDGSLVELSGPAVAAAATAEAPYALRVTHDDCNGRLKKGDIVIVSQRDDKASPVVIIRENEKLMIAGRIASTGKFSDLQTGRTKKGGAEVVGACIAIVWAPL